MTALDLLKEAAAVAGALTVLLGALWWLVKPRVVEWFRRTIVQPVQETHRSLTVNGHVSETPTLRDQVDTLTEQGRYLLDRANTNATGISAIRQEQADVRRQLKDHSEESRAAMAIYRRALADQGIHLPVAPGEDGFGIEEEAPPHD